MKKVFIILFLLLFPVFVFALDKVDINTATLSQLDELTGIGLKYAQAIIDARPFSSVDDLLKVKGIGPATLQKIKNQGLACVNCQTQQSTPNPNLTPTPPATPTPAPTPTPTPVVVYPSKIFINEVLPNPEGADETEEWVEISNSNNFDVDLTGWQIQDITGTPTTFMVPKSVQILANDFLVFKRPETKIMLNNDQDGLNLLAPDKKIADFVNFTKAPLNQSYNKTSTGWHWSITLTPGSKNIISATTKNSSKTLPKIKNSDKNNIAEPGLADLSQSINTNQVSTKNSNPWFLFFTALVITIISAIAVLFIKFKLKKII